MLCPKRKYIEYEVQIEHNDALKIEALSFEVGARLSVLSYIKENKVDLSDELLEKYRSEYIGFYIELEKAISDCAYKYLKDLNNKVSYKVDYERCVLIWAEEVQDEETN